MKGILWLLFPFREYLREVINQAQYVCVMKLNVRASVCARVCACVCVRACVLACVCMRADASTE